MYKHKLIVSEFLFGTAMYILVMGFIPAAVAGEDATDQGNTWNYYSTIAYVPEDPNPELPGMYVGPHEPSVTLLPDGQMLAMLRMQYSDLPGEYKPMYVSWSNDVGRTWTKPRPIKPHLMCISPTLQVLDNGVGGILIA